MRKICVLLSLFYCSLLQALEFDVHKTCALIKEMILAQEKGAYLCFSEADIRVAVGRQGDLWDQIEMQEILALNEENVLKSRFLPYTALNGSRNGDQWALDVFTRTKHSWIDSYAALAPAFLSTIHREDCIRFFQFLQSKNVLIVGDSYIEPEIQNLLFGRNAEFISSNDTDRIELENYTVILLCMDSEGKVLAKRLLDQLGPIFIIDFSGFKEALCNWNTDTWEKWIQKENRIKILYTSALIPHKFEERQREYVACLKLLEKYGYKDKTYVVESGPYTSLSVFDEYCSHVFYSNTNDMSFTNKGVNESKASLAAFNYFDFDDEDMIIKLTGRYLFNSDHFLKMVESQPDVDAFASKHPSLGVTTGCFGMRSKYYKRMLRELDFVEMERRSIDFEREVYIFLQKMISEGAKVVYLDKIGITANVANAEVQQW